VELVRFLALLLRLLTALTLRLPALLPRFVALRPREPGLTGDFPLVVGVEGRLEPVLPRFPLLLQLSAVHPLALQQLRTALRDSRITKVTRQLAAQRLQARVEAENHAL
jgi:hypothetical protein